MKLVNKKHIEITVKKATKKEFLMSILGLTIFVIIIWLVVK